eukprot:gene16097-17718_t
MASCLLRITEKANSLAYLYQPSVEEKNAFRFCFLGGGGVSLKFSYGHILPSANFNNDYLFSKTELQVHIHDSECFPLKQISEAALSDTLAFAITAYTIKEPSVKIPFQLRELSQNGEYRKQEQSSNSERVYKEGEYLVYSCQVQDADEIVLQIEISGLGDVLFPCKLLDNFHQKLCLPIFAQNHCQTTYKGVFQFECLVICPWKNEDLRQKVNETHGIHWHPEFSDKKRSLEMGHRGCGTTHGKSRSSKTPTENTIASFTRAFEKGADYVELDVQLTKDFVPVVFHDFYTAACVKRRDCDDFKKITIAVNDLTLEELASLEFTFTGESKVDGKGVSDSSHGLFPTLEKVLDDSPPELGIFIELKFPAQEKSGAWESDPRVDKNKLVDRTLDVVYSTAGSRRIILGSFDPAVCTMLRLKQPLYKVVFITCGENDIYPLCMDHRSRTIQMAINFAVSEDLLGISVMADPLVDKMSELLKKAKQCDIEVFTWGDANADPQFIKQQTELGIAGIIYDRLDELKS